MFKTHFIGLLEKIDIRNTKLKLSLPSRHFDSFSNKYIYIFYITFNIRTYINYLVLVDFHDYSL